MAEIRWLIILFSEAWSSALWEAVQGIGGLSSGTKALITQLKCIEQTQLLLWFPFQTQQVVGKCVCVCFYACGWTGNSSGFMFCFLIKLSPPAGIKCHIKGFVIVSSCEAAVSMTIKLSFLWVCVFLVRRNCFDWFFCSFWSHLDSYCVGVGRAGYRL